MRDEIVQKSSLKTLKSELGAINVQYIKGGEGNDGDRGGVPPKIGMIIEDTSAAARVKR
jgi:hypothetical protein